jgi:protein-disulfide isomerase
MLGSLKIHWPSLGIGIGIMVTAIVIFFIYSQNFKTIPVQENVSQNIQDSSQHVTLDIITGNSSPLLGSKDAPITMIEFGDYQCFYCHKFYNDTESEIVKNYIETGKVKLIFKDFTIIGQDSVTAANSAHCAQEQGKFWQFHDALYNNWSGENTGWASLENLVHISKQVGLDQDKFNQCITQEKYMQVVKGSVSDANALGLTGTPDFFVIAPDNSVTKIVGAQPYSAFDEIFKSKLQ